jgi:tRNA modification GTPase
MNIEILDTQTTIVAPATAAGGAVMVIRLSGAEAIAIGDKLFRGKQQLNDAAGYTLHYGSIVDTDGSFLDDVVVALFRAPRSYTGDDTVEFTIHGSQYIASRVMQLAVNYGARMATAGEFTRRAFLAGKLDLSRAEAVADVIASDSKWSHRVAATQMRGDYAKYLSTLRGELLKLCSLLELELDFSEEDVEFANREILENMLTNIGKQISSLTSSFALGNALKEGVAVAIVGEPNVGKSTLLNRLVEEDRAMVSDIAGTTRDTIEATRIIDGIRFRFIDTAGMHSTDDKLEQMGIERTRRAMGNAHIVLHVASAEQPQFEDMELGEEQTYIRIVNKMDNVGELTSGNDNSLIYISAKEGRNIDMLIDKMLASIPDASDDVMVINVRHYDALQQASAALDMTLNAMRMNIPTDLLSEDIHQVLHHLGEITGEITSDDILQSIFSKFCIGK